MILALAFLLLLNVFILGLKLTLKQDLMVLPKELIPYEIGQFLHSIKDLLRLAQYLDPNRNKLSLDFLIHYNTYGCTDTRVFNWTRIQFIMTYPNLSRIDKLILLNGNCISLWPDLLTIPNHDLTFLLNIFPEINPLKHLTSFDLETKDIWRDVVSKFNEKWRIILMNAQSYSSENLNFVPFVDELIKNRSLSLLNDFNPDHFSLIGPKSMETCYSLATRKAKCIRCYNFVFQAIKHSSKFGPRDLFYWTLNLATAAKFKKFQLSKITSDQFEILIKSCVRGTKLMNFIEKFSKVIIDCISSKNSKANSESVYTSENDSEIERIFANLLDDDDLNAMDVVEEEDSDSRPILPSLLFNAPKKVDDLFMAIEFYNWLNENYFDFDFSPRIFDNALKMIQKRLGSFKVKSGDSAGLDYYLNFFVNAAISKKSLQIPSFKSFIRLNFDPNNPNILLFNTLRQISWINGPDGGFIMAQILKSFTSHEDRLNQLRKVCFKHPHDNETSASIDIYFDNDSTVNESIFTGVYESLLANEILVYPLKVNAISSGFTSILFDNLSDKLETILQNFWLSLASDSSKFMYLIEDDASIEEEFMLPEYAPYPWTHPNILMAVGCVMTLAMLHGIKLKNWRLKRSLFRSLFSISMSSAFDDEDKAFPENSHFMTIYSLNDYLKAINGQSETGISSSIDYLVKIKGNVSSQFIKNYQKCVIKGIQKSDDKVESQSLLMGKVFGLMADLSENVSLKPLNHHQIFNLIPSEMFYTSQLNPNFVKKMIKSLSIKADDKINNVSRKMAKFQIYSLYLGVQPLTRFLNAKDAYKAIFF